MFSFRLVFSLLAFVMVVYLLRHYIFTAIALIYGRASENAFKRDGDWEPNLSVVVPAHNEERVIGRLLERIDEFTYPKEKLQVVVVDDVKAVVLVVVAMVGFAQTSIASRSS